MDSHYELSFEPPAAIASSKSVSSSSPFGGFASSASALPVGWEVLTGGGVVGGAKFFGSDSDMADHVQGWQKGWPKTRVEVEEGLNWCAFDEFVATVFICEKRSDERRARSYSHPEQAHP